MTEALLDPRAHLLAELRRLDLILLLHSLRNRSSPAAGALDQESSRKPSAPDNEVSAEEATRRLDAHGQWLSEAVRATLAKGIRLPLVDLCRNLELDPISLGIFMLALAPHVDRHYARSYALLQGDAAPTAPRVELALQIFGETPADRLALESHLGPAAPLSRSGFLRLVDPPEGPAISDLDRLLKLSPRVLRFLLEQEGAEAEVEIARARTPLPPPTRSLREALARFAKLLELREIPGPVCVLLSEDQSSALSGTRELGQREGKPSLLIDLDQAGASRAPIERCIEAAFDEARLIGALLAITGFDALDDKTRETALRASVDRLARFDGACLLILTKREPDLRGELGRRRVISLDAPLPDHEEREAIWATALAHRPDLHTALPELSLRYRLSASEIASAARFSETLDAAKGPNPEHLGEASRRESHHGLDELAQRITPWGSWEDLVLPPSSLEMLKSIPDRMRHRERVFRDWALASKVASWRGMAVLFAGAPGTGKTMSASLVAKALGLDLYRIDLAGVVSKYIGETEKNLERVFKAARRSHAVLFFDEADALFGKRTEVKDAHDRNANVETSYLLQRIEDFEGLVLLSTNLKKNIDPAFLRRIEVLVDFPEPDKELRHRLWTSMLPKSMPREEDIDFAFLAECFDAFSGGHIKNAVQAAALRASAEGTRVGMRHLVRGVREELIKQGKIVRARDFGPYAALVPDEGTPEFRAQPLRRSRG